MIYFMFSILFHIISILLIPAYIGLGIFALRKKTTDMDVLVLVSPIGLLFLSYLLGFFIPLIRGFIFYGYWFVFLFFATLYLLLRSHLQVISGESWKARMALHVLLRIMLLAAVGFAGMIFPNIIMYVILEPLLYVFAYLIFLVLSLIQLTRIPQAKGFAITCAFLLALNTVLTFYFTIYMLAAAALGAS